MGDIMGHTRAAIAVFVGGVYLIAQIVGAVAHAVAGYMPILIIGNSLSTTKPVSCGGNAAQCPRLLSAWAGLGVLCLYAAVALLIGGGAVLPPGALRPAGPAAGQTEGARDGAGGRAPPWLARLRGTVRARAP